MKNSKSVCRCRYERTHRHPWYQLKKRWFVVPTVRNSKICTWLHRHFS